MNKIQIEQLLVEFPIDAKLKRRRVKAARLPPEIREAIVEDFLILEDSTEVAHKYALKWYTVMDVLLWNNLVRIRAIERKLQHRSNGFF